MKYTQVHTALLLKCATRPRFRKKDDTGGEDTYEIRIMDMVLLANTRDEYIKEFHIELPLEAATPQLRKELAKELKGHPGAARLFIDLRFSHDGAEDRLDLFSKKFTVAPDYGLYAFLDRHNLRHHLVKKVTL